MDVQVWDDQHELTYSSYVRTRVVILKTCRRRWVIGRNGERRSGISAQTARHDDDDYFSRGRVDQKLRTISSISLHDRRLTAPNINAQLDQCCEKMCWHPLLGEDSVKLVYMAKLQSRNLLRKQINIKRLQWTKAYKDWIID